MNALDTAAAIVERAWCRSTMVAETGDKFCAAGALISAMGYEYKFIEDSNYVSGGYYSNDAVIKNGEEFGAYDVLEDTPEGRALAKAIISENWQEHDADTSTIYDWNDNHAKDHDDVARIMRKGARILDEQQG